MVYSGDEEVDAVVIVEDEAAVVAAVEGGELTVGVLRAARQSAQRKKTSST